MFRLSAATSPIGPSFVVAGKSRDGSNLTDEPWLAHLLAELSCRLCRGS